ncbi:MAG TPA: 30S ribosomal protein S8 [Firmicutes bacterium]|nr:30S ribosomal protein S8 [Bacillota bacterium]
MPVSDPIADMLTRIRNAVKARQERVDIPGSRLLRGMAEILKEEGYIRDYEWVTDNPQGTLRIHLKYGPQKTRVVTGLKRISRPGLRVYAGKDELPRVLGGLGIAIVSTPKGLMTDKKARQLGVGGEVLCYIW